MVFRTIVNLTARRIPLIKFRKGGIPNLTAAGEGQEFAGTTASTSAVPEYLAAEAIEDWELPPRWRRKPIDPDECAFINRGGPD